MRLSGTVVVGRLAYSDLFQRDFDTGVTAKLDDETKRSVVLTSDWGLQLWLISIIANADFGTGTGIGIVLPIISASSTRAANFEDKVVRQDALGTDLTESTDTGIGDFELRVSQELLRPIGITGKYVPRVIMAAGFSAPTGNFIVKKAGGADTDTSRYVSVGRGVWWALFDVNVFGAIADRLGYMLQFGSRYPFGTLTAPGEEYAFQWGAEARVTAGLTGVLIKGVLNASLGSELQWRSRGLERFFLDDGFEPFANGGMTMLSISPTLQAVLGGGVTLSVNARVPLWVEIYGTQPVSAFGVFAALSYSWAAEPPPPKASVEKGEKPSTERISKLIVPGKVTMIDYWATWCEPCKKLAPHLEEFAAGRDDVVLKKVDATEWGAAEMKQYLPAVAGLPVVDIYGVDGRLIERIVGPECFKFKSRIPPPVQAK